MESSRCRGIWDAAIASLITAKRKGPASGRNIRFIGDDRGDYLPDYYLGIAYLNTKHFAESDAAFDDVKKSG